MTIAKVNEYFIPFLANGDSSGMTIDEFDACVKFQEEFGTSFSVFEHDGEWVYDCGGLCDICGLGAKCVWIYNDADDLDTLNRELGFNEEDEE